ncbi:MAG: ABC-F family ATP-binding cassette domain-containing protein [Deltaproteobacteria bacterium]|jgi:ATPase subunit of ABC transporter with duplicated ATPase domains|nr:ABC-F family ATP-binding cassette domain-containing protein [Deltaproteobacteria bacterium]MBT4089425.1 ABC-F family ATP-binding cassette domain-containing protein [Deltaproteobacteria bacterium]MBT4269263.1 ABC-F family ATP-binding cassette domain-containing protein [Deltaproteobacteria bacterium]MBT4639222.1 ABC-F family ATP-binding cassette domain-containing protein [Deltaproteobacteria bacterium]MBT6500120.1 ABC-F family ATP-binding cassette domain-containing protein [Deltaproteobacteria
MISVTDLGMHFGEKTLFEQANFQLNHGNHYGLVGANGSGKSTLMQILSGEIVAEQGTVNFPAALKLGILKQNHFAFEQHPIIDVVLMGKKALWEALNEKSSLSEGKQVTEQIGKRIADLEIVIADHNGYQAEAEASELLAGLGILPENQKNTLSTLSGGYKLRVLLAQCLFSEPDFLLLDEPTNHLDIASIVWLEEYLNRFPGTCLIISHDQYFLNRVSTHVVDIDYEEIKIYKGNYDQYKREKELEISQKEMEISKQEKKREDLQLFIDRFKAKATKARQANSKSKQLNRMDEIVIKRSSRLSPFFAFDICRPSGKIAFSTKKLSKKYDSTQVLENLSVSVNRGEKLAVIGPNGIGKSTFLKLVAGIIEPTQGGVEPGHEVYAGYCPQDHQDIIPDNTSPYEWLYTFSPGETISLIRGLLGRVLIRGDDADKSTAALSGGESARLIFAGMMLQKPNLLLLDEPTNHMDIESLEALGKALKVYSGTVVCVSHDRRFIESFATGILELKPNGFDLFPGSYREYLEKQGEDYLDRSLTPSKSKKTNHRQIKTISNKEWKEKSKNISKMKRGVQKSEVRISELEEQISGIDEKMMNDDLYKTDNSPQLRLLLDQKELLNLELNNTLTDWEKQQAVLDELTSTSS